MASKQQVKNLLQETSDKFLELFSVDGTVKSAIANKFYISGGCIASLTMNEEPNDYDIYFVDRESLEMACNYLVKAKPELVACKTDNAITLNNKFQVIRKFFGEPLKVIELFDFCHCCCYYRKSSSILFFHENAMESIATKHLIYKHTEYPVGSLFRLKKLLNRGWEISKGNWFKIILDVNELDLSDPLVLKNQISGIYDANYLGDLPRGSKVDTETLLSLMDQSDRTPVKLKPCKDRSSEGGY